MRAALLVARALAAVAMVVGLVAGVRAIRDRSPTVVDNVERSSRAHSEATPGPADVTSNPFRVDRAVRRAAAPIASASVAEPGEDAAEEPEPVLRPGWRLSGIVAGPTAIALLEGVQGASRARLLQVGDTIGAIRVAEIGPDFIRVVQDDLSWTFEFSEFSSANGRQ